MAGGDDRGDEGPVSVVTVRVQYLEDTDPFACANFPEPRRAPTCTLDGALPLGAQIPALHRLLGAPLKLEDCALQVSPSGYYLDPELSLEEQREMLEGFYEEISKGRKPTLILRTQLSVRVNAILEKLYGSSGPELRRSLFSLKQIFQEDQDLVPEFVHSEGLSCLIRVGAAADHNYQSYILRALGQLMLFVDGMLGVVAHSETVQWLYTLCASLSRLVVKTALKLLLVFVEYSENNAPLFIRAVNSVASATGAPPWANLVSILAEKNGADPELLVYTVTLINKTLAALPDQDSFYDVTDALEQQGMEALVQRHLGTAGTDVDLRTQLVLYENALKLEDGDIEEAPGMGGRRERRKPSSEEGKRSRRSLEGGGCPVRAPEPGPTGPASPVGPTSSTSPTSSPVGPPSGLQASVNLFPTISLAPSADTSSERSIYKLHQTAPVWAPESPPVPQSPPGQARLETRFLENVAAAETEKQVALAQGWAETLPGAMPDEADGHLDARELWDSPETAPVPRTPHSPAPRVLLRTQRSLEPEPKEPLMPSSPKAEPTWELPTRAPKLCIGDLDFSDLGEDEDQDMLNVESAEVGKGVPPPPPPLPLFSGVPPPPPPLPPPPIKGPFPPPPPLAATLPPSVPDSAALPTKRKTVKLFWRELKLAAGHGVSASRFGPCATLWASLEPVSVDTARLEHLFESRAKDVLPSKKAGEGRRTMTTVLDPKRSNAINIGLTTLPPVHVIKAALLNFDEFAVSKDGIEKLLTMMPTEEEQQKIEEAQLANPDIPLGPAENFLMTLASISGLAGRLQLWAFKLDYDSMEREIAEPLFDLKVGMEQLVQNATFRCILATLLAVGNFLNGSQSSGFELSYLEKVSEVKDTVRRQSLLHHLCSLVLQTQPESSDLYSEIPALTRCAKVDFEQLTENLGQLERRSRAAEESLRSLAKHELAPALRARLTHFLAQCARRVAMLKIVHRRVCNRFHAFLLYLGYTPQAAREVRITQFCHTLREFALEYRTCRERVLQQQQKRATYRERNKTRGRMITETEKFSGVAGEAPSNPSVPVAVSSGPGRGDADSHASMKNLLTSRSENTTHNRRSRGMVQSSSPIMPTVGSSTASPEEPPGSSLPSDTSDEIMDMLVQSVTKSSPRALAARERKRSRGNRKSLRRTLKSGLGDDLVQALGLSKGSGLEV
ncbi:FH1/FH2 domain-containing protein 1 isoform X1 [Saimiri boliviensis]|uniref:FH1/FH2 domain-containing protein 1 isoform X1 n=1 Tax=Saimiri boliviensis TaxID=27679 RepID=UPI00193DE16D|nr:FH1/FH2 domain-containing protein 1 isoform X3 [Saimiri boliviensis boliviensis]